MLPFSTENEQEEINLDDDDVDDEDDDEEEDGSSSINDGIPAVDVIEMHLMMVSQVLHGMLEGYAEIMLYYIKGWQGDCNFSTRIHTSIL